MSWVFLVVTVALIIVIGWIVSWVARIIVNDTPFRRNEPAGPIQCPKCRRQIPDGTTSCKVCGWKLQVALAERVTGMYWRLRMPK
jgi:hypothetical protein